MGAMETSRIGKRGTIVIPAKLRERYRLEEGSFVITEELEEGILLRPAAIVPVETYTAERKAEFLLNNAVSAADYRAAVSEVKKLGLDPRSIPHRKAF
jgi:AbrB family looped-hinge helix DNA binding protein